jgi:PAS domain S-box-containing protein
MNLNRFQRNSLKTRITLLTLLIFLASLWLLGYTVSHSLRADMERVLGAQQHTMASHMAGDISDQIDTRITALQRVAQSIEHRHIQTAAELQKFLEDLPVFQSLFNGGTFITDAYGQTIASLPVSLDRVGVNFIDRDYIANTIRDGNATIGRPVMGRQLKAPIFGIGVPIKNNDGKIVAALAGVIILNESNFMDRIERSYVSSAADYLLIDATHRVIVASSNKERLMEKLPEPLINPVLDKFIDGFEGSEIFINPRGFEVISGVKHLNNANWYVAVALPTRIAFESITRMERRIFIMTLLLTFLSGGLTWWVLVRQLKPLQITARKLADLANPESTLEPLPIRNKDEIGQLITGFNRLLAELRTRQETLKENEERYRTIFRTSPDAVSITRFEDGKFIEINDGYSKIFEWEREEIIGKTAIDIGIWASLSDREHFRKFIESQGSCERLETRFVAKSGRIVFALVSANTILLNGDACLLSVT